MTPKLRVIQPKDGEIIDVVAPPACVDMKIRIGASGPDAYKFIFENGAVLYVPLPRSQRDTADEVAVRATAGPMRA